MKKIALCTALAALSLATTAFAADAPKAEAEKKPEAKAEAKTEHKMEMPKPGDEAKKLAAFYAHGGSFTGTIAAGAMGPDSKEMKTHGKMNCTALFGGMGYSCDVEDKMAEMTWKGHVVVMWDTLSKSYKSTCVDNMGTFTTWAGTMSDDGKKFSITSDQEMNMGPNTPNFKDRLTWDMSSGKMLFTDEHQINGEWKLWESADMGAGKAAPKEKAPATDKKS
ncbi:MAG TPA: DUF1579 family protein [bacterium]|nr:DUF1579 family protein [bacterium]